MPWPDTLAAVHRPPAMRGRSSDFSNSAEVARSDAQRSGPSAPSLGPPKVTGRRASSEEAKAVPHPVLDLAEGLLHKLQRVLLSRDVPAAPALAWAPP